MSEGLKQQPKKAPGVEPGEETESGTTRRGTVQRSHLEKERGISAPERTDDEAVSNTAIHVNWEEGMLHAEQPGDGTSAVPSEALKSKHVLGAKQEEAAGVGAVATDIVPGVGTETVANGTSSTPSEKSEKEATVEAKKEDVVPEAQRSKSKTILIMFALCLAVFLAALDITIITTALPTIAAAFHASSADYTWIGSAYTLAAAAATPSWGKLSDIWGRKPVILGANVVFFVGSLIAAVAVNINMLIAGRVIQGIGGGGLIVLVQICISDLFSMRSRGVYFGVIGMVWAIASACGPILGGVFSEKVSWRWCFYINLPFDGLAFIILLLFLTIETPKTPLAAGLRAIDWFGSLTIVGGTIMVLLGLEFGGITHPWGSAIVICLIVFGLLVMAVFAVIEWKIAKYPVIPLRLFKRRSNIAALAVCFVHGFVFISGSYFLPLYFQAVLGASPILSGVYLFPFVISLSLMSAATGVFIRKTGQYLPPIYFGLAFQTLGFGLFINFPIYASWSRVIIFQIIAGLGVGTNFQSPLIALQSLVPPRDIATATATFGFTRNIATAISIVVGGVIFQNGMQKRESSLRASLPGNIASDLGGGSAGANTAIVHALVPSERVAATQAYTESLRTMWIFYTAIAFVGLLASLAITRQQLNKKHEITKGGLEEQEAARRERKSMDAAEREEKRRRKSGMAQVEEEKVKEEV